MLSSLVKPESVQTTPPKRSNLYQFLGASPRNAQLSPRLKRPPGYLVQPHLATLKQRSPSSRESSRKGSAQQRMGWEGGLLPFQSGNAAV